MAHTTTVTKQQVIKTEGVDDYLVIIHVVIEDEVPDIVLEKDYSQRYNSGTTLGDIQSGFLAMLQADWDKYIAEKGIFDAAAFDTVVSNIETAADSYINP